MVRIDGAHVDELAGEIADDEDDDGRATDDARTNGANIDASDLPAKAKALVRLRTRQGKRRLLTLEHLDGRTAAAQAARHLIDALVDELGGIERLSADAQQHAQRAAMLGAIAADFEARWIAGHRINLKTYILVAGAQRRSLAALGLEKPGKVEENPYEKDEAAADKRAAEDERKHVAEDVA